MNTLAFFGLLLTSFILRTTTALTLPAPKIILITLDGVRYQDIFQGTDPAISHYPAIPARRLLPNIYSAFVDGGMAIGQSSEMDVSGPNYISLPGYLEILRGHPTTDCQINQCTPHTDMSILDLYHQWHPTSEIATIASWEQLRYVGNTSPDYTISIGHQHQHWDQMVYKYPNTFHDDEREDIYTIAETNAYLEHHQPDFLWVSLGDTDEYAHMGSYENYWRALKTADNFIGTLVRDLPANTTFILTTDHGRGTDWRGHGGFDPTSKRVFMMMRGPRIPHLGMVDLHQPITSSWIFSTLQGLIEHNTPEHSILGLPAMLPRAHP